MSKYSIDERKLQAVKCTDLQGESNENYNYVDRETGEIIQRLNDDKFDWRERKKQTLVLADLYKGKQSDYAVRALSCSTWLEYLSNGDMSKKQLHHFNACKLRLCPLCAARKAKLMANRLMAIIEQSKISHPNTQLIFLTLTIMNVPGYELRAALDLLTGAWSKLMRRRPVMRAIKGWFRALEITRNRAQNTYHPHIHAILVVEDDYFDRTSGLYLTHEDWVKMWQESLQVDYRPVVGVQSTYASGKKGKATASSKIAVAAVAEAAKYATKSTDYVNVKLPRAEAKEVVEVYTKALHRKRMTALGGWLLDASRELELDDIENTGDLVHDEKSNGELTEATAELLLTYGWHFGVAEHILTDIEDNPKYVVGKENDD